MNTKIYGGGINNPRRLSVIRQAVIIILAASFPVPSVLAQNALDAEARSRAAEFWSKKYTQCGDLHYTRFDDGQFDAVRNFTWSVIPSSISQADRLNNIEWRGRTSPAGSASRIWRPNSQGGWQKWENGMGVGVFEVAMKKANGRWTFEPSDYSALRNASAPTCAEVPREKTAVELSAEQRNKQVSACVAYLRVLSGVGKGSAEAFLQSGLDPRDCKDNRSRTVLILNADGCSDSEVVMLIDSGADVNAEDEDGRTALDHANATLSAYKTKTDSWGDHYRKTCAQTIRALSNRSARAGSGRVRAGSNAYKGPCNLDELTRGDYRNAQERILSFEANGGDIRCKDPNGNTALMWVAARRLSLLVAFLINRGVDPNARNNSGWTALMFAEKAAREEPGGPDLSNYVIKLLKEGGARDDASLPRGPEANSVPKPTPSAASLAKKDASPRSNLPPGFKDYQANGFAVAYPGSWQIGPQPGGSFYVVPQGGVARGELLFGALLGYYVPQAGAAVRLDASTKEFLEGRQKADSNLLAGRSERADIAGKPALLTKLQTRTSLPQDPNQTVYLYTIAREAGLWYMVLAVPTSRLNEFDPIFRQMIETIQFPN